MQRYAVENFSHDDPRVSLDSGVHTAVGGKKVIVVRQDASAQISRLGAGAVAIDGVPACMMYVPVSVASEQ